MNPKEKDQEATSRNQPGAINPEQEKRNDQESQHINSGMEPDELAREKGRDTNRDNQEIPPGNEETLGNP